jgi:hypothetical protein
VEVFKGLIRNEKGNTSQPAGSRHRTWRAAYFACYCPALLNWAAFLESMTDMPLKRLQRAAASAEHSSGPGHTAPVTTERTP